jgi:hypothetical protein
MIYKVILLNIIFCLLIILNLVAIICYVSFYLHAFGNGLLVILYITNRMHFVSS